MFAVARLVLTLGVGYCFWQWVDISHLFSLLPQMNVALSIFAGAVLVRLARGMPALDWKHIPREKRNELTEALVRISREYAGLLGLLGLLVLGSVALQGITEPVVSALPERVVRGISAAVGGLSAFVIVRMYYVVWRDLDIVRLQQRVIAAMTDSDQREKEAALAAERLSDIRASNPSGGERPPAVRWG